MSTHRKRIKLDIPIQIPKYLPTPSPDILGDPAWIHLISKQEKYNTEIMGIKRPDVLSLIQNLCEQQGYFQETMFTSVLLLSKFLKIEAIRGKNYAVAASVCTFLAAKYGEELNEPCANEISDWFKNNSLDHRDYKKMEKRVLKAVDFNVNSTTPHVLLDQLFSTLGHILENKFENDSLLQDFKKRLRLAIEPLLLQLLMKSPIELTPCQMLSQVLSISDSLHPMPGMINQLFQSLLK